MRSGKGTMADERPLFVRILTTFLAIAIALNVSTCVSDGGDASALDSDGPAVGLAQDEDGAAESDSDAKSTDSSDGETASADPADADLDATSGDGAASADGAGAVDRTRAQSASDEALIRYGITIDALHPSGNEASKAINGNDPIFENSLMDRAKKGPFEEYSSLDSLGRATLATACAGIETMPTEERGSIGEVRPSGWHLAKYDWVDGKYLYNRCHLIGFQLTGENANESNLITGTRYMNVDGMLPYENDIASYIEDTGNHVLYRVTPIYDGDDLVARGVLMEAYSIEDGGAGLSFCVFCPNVQPGVSIDYATGENKADGTISGSGGMIGE